MATLDEILTLSDLKRELRIRSAFHDPLLERHRASAIGHVSALISRPLVSRSGVELLADAPCRGDDILVFRARDVVGAGGALPVHYRAQASARGPARDATIDAGGVAVSAGAVEAWPPADGWPAMRAEVGVGVIVDVGVASEVVAAHPQWGQAAVLVARELYEGNALDALPSGNALERLVHPFWQPYVPS